MDQYWKYVDYLIPDDQKKTISDKEAKRRIDSTIVNLNKLQVP